MYLLGFGVDIYPHIMSGFGTGGSNQFRQCSYIFHRDGYIEALVLHGILQSARGTAGGPLEIPRRVAFRFPQTRLLGDP